jgi:hypothetical protein
MTAFALEFFRLFAMFEARPSGRNTARATLGVRIQRIVDTRCIQRIVDIGHTHLNLGGELCPVPLDSNSRRPAKTSIHQAFPLVFS